MRRSILVVPCYNEAKRFSPESFRELLVDPEVELLFVDDGSVDDTAVILGEFCALYPVRARLHRLETNRGKAEAVRVGLARAFADGAVIAGYLDADLSTPPHEALRLLRELGQSYDVVIGARVALLGSVITRTSYRHYLGRLFASAASLVLALPVYDTQCGAKFFRRGAAIEGALAQPFLSRWAFDVELLGRLVLGSVDHPPVAPGRILEVPLRRWADQAGSKLRPRDMLASGMDLARIALDLRRRRGQRSQEVQITPTPASRSRQPAQPARVNGSKQAGGDAQRMTASPH
jgi:hypothetical protein